jgi:hypothetical protein
MITKPLLTLLLIFGLFKASYGQNIPEEMSARFFDIYKKQSFDNALEYLYSTNKNAKDYQSGLANLKTQVDSSVQTVGHFLSYELISKASAGKSIMLLTFLVKCEKDALTFRVLFYKPADVWQAQTFKFDNKIGDELEDASKAYKASQ